MLCCVEESSLKSFKRYVPASGHSSALLDARSSVNGYFVYFYKQYSVRVCPLGSFCVSQKKRKSSRHHERDGAADGFVAFNNNNKKPHLNLRPLCFYHSSWITSTTQQYRTGTDTCMWRRLCYRLSLEHCFSTTRTCVLSHLVFGSAQPLLNLFTTRRYVSSLHQVEIQDKLQTW